MERFALLGAGVMGFFSVALGAFGAHGLKSKLAPLADGAQRLDWWNLGAHYMVVHALALGLVAWIATRTTSASVTVATWGFLVGCVVFSGSLYAMALTGTRWLGAITPLGGLGFLVGWASVIVAAWSLRAT